MIGVWARILPVTSHALFRGSSKSADAEQERPAHAAATTRSVPRVTLAELAGIAPIRDGLANSLNDLTHHCPILGR
jgi:hypothetical protein